jgi:hypothetical protein
MFVSPMAGRRLSQQVNRNARTLLRMRFSGDAQSLLLHSPAVPTDRSRKRTSPLSRKVPGAFSCLSDSGLCPDLPVETVPAGDEAERRLRPMAAKRPAPY